MLTKDYPTWPPKFRSYYLIVPFVLNRKEERFLVNIRSCQLSSLLNAQFILADGSFKPMLPGWPNSLDEQLDTVSPSLLQSISLLSDVVLLSTSGV